MKLDHMARVALVSVAIGLLAGTAPAVMAKPTTKLSVEEAQLT